MKRIIYLALILVLAGSCGNGGNKENIESQNPSGTEMEAPINANGNIPDTIGPGETRFVDSTRTTDSVQGGDTGRQQ